MVVCRDFFRGIGETRLKQIQVDWLKMTCGPEKVSIK